MHREKADSLTHVPRAPMLGRPLAFAALVLVVPAATVLTAFGVAPGTVPASLARSVVQ